MQPEIAPVVPPAWAPRLLARTSPECAIPDGIRTRTDARRAPSGKARRTRKVRRILEDLAGGEVRPDGTRVGRPGDVRANDERLALLQAQAAAQPVLQSQTGCIQVGVALAQLGPAAPDVGEQRDSQHHALLPE